MTEKHKLESAINSMLTTGQWKTSKKKQTRELDELASEPAIVHATLVSRYPVLRPIN